MQRLEIVVAMEDRRHGFPVGQILDCKMSGIEVRDMLGFFEQVTGRIKLDALRNEMAERERAFARGLRNSP